MSPKSFQKIVGLREVVFAVSTHGVTVYSGRFNEPRFIEWDQKGKCGKCKSSTADIDFYVDGNGIELYSSRFNAPRHVFFDLPYPLPDACIFRVRMKGQSYSIPFEKTKVEEISTTTEEQKEIKQENIEIKEEPIQS